MNPTRPSKIIATLIALVLVSGSIGFIVGQQFRQETSQRRFDPEHWNEYAMQTLRQKLDLSAEQEERIQTIVNETVVEMKGVHQETIQKTVGIVDRFLSAVDQELTPDQRKIAATLSPSSEEVTIDLLKVGADE